MRIDNRNPEAGDNRSPQVDPRWHSNHPLLKIQHTAVEFLDKLIFLLTAGLLLTPALVNAQPDQASAKAPISQPLVREGDFALKLVEALKVGKAGNEAEAETMLTGAGIAPKNGWIADYPVTPEIIGELQKAVSEAADAKKLSLGKQEALKIFQTANGEIGLPVAAEITGSYLIHFAPSFL